jgi:hypothetical protein
LDDDDDDEGAFTTIHAVVCMSYHVEWKETT